MHGSSVSQNSVKVHFVHTQTVCHGDVAVSGRELQVINVSLAAKLHFHLCPAVHVCLRLIKRWFYLSFGCGICVWKNEILFDDYASDGKAFLRLKPGWPCDEMFVIEILDKPVSDEIRKWASAR